MTQRPRRPPFYVTKTLLGGFPDINRRSVYAEDTNLVIKTFNADMKPWTPQMQADLDEFMKKLIADVQLK